MKIAILGAGALGCYYGARLQESRQDVSFIVRSEYGYLKEHGLQVKSLAWEYLPAPHQRLPGHGGSRSGRPRCRCMEKHGKRRIFQSPSPLMGPDTTVVTLQNGMGNAEEIARIIPAERIYVGLCFICAMREKPGHVNHLEGGNIQFAPFIPTPEGTEKARELSELFANAGIKTRAFDAAEQIQWYKLVWNIPFNGLCLALGGISIAELYQNPENVVRARRIMEEVVQAARARGYALPEDLVEFHLSRTETMGAFIPSSAVDYNEGRPVEYTAIWGDPLSKARQAGASVPEWELLDKAIRKRLNMN